MCGTKAAQAFTVPPRCTSRRRFHSSCGISRRGAAAWVAVRRHEDGDGTALADGLRCCYRHLATVPYVRRQGRPLPPVAPSPATTNASCWSHAITAAMSTPSAPVTNAPLAGSALDMQASPSAEPRLEVRTALHRLDSSTDARPLRLTELSCDSLEISLP